MVFDKLRSNGCEAFVGQFQKVESSAVCSRVAGLGMEFQPQGAYHFRKCG